MNAGRTLPLLLEHSAQGHPDARLVFPAQERVLTLCELARQSAAFAAGLAERGVRPGELVGLLLPPSPEFVVALFGVQRAGAVATALPLPAAMQDPPAYVGRLRHILADGAIPTLVLDLRFAAFAPSGPGLQICAPAELVASAAAPPSFDVVDACDRAIVQYTSGSTTDPKGVVLTHASVLASLAAIGEGIQARPDDVLAHWLPLHHDMGLVATLTAVRTGATQHLWPPSSFIRDPLRFLRRFAAVRASVYAGPNFSYGYLLAHAAEESLDGLDLSAWRIAFNGAEPIDPHTLEQFAARFRPYGFRATTMFPVYGLAEATLAVTLPDLGEPPRIDWVDRALLASGRLARPRARSEETARGVVCVGRPLRGHEVRIVREGGALAAEREVGEIHVRGPALMTEYYRRPVETAEVLRDGWLHTGDLGYLVDGRLYVTGRSKEIIIVRGVNHYPQDVESLVQKVPGIYRGRCVAFAVDGDAGERLVVVAETTEKSPAARAEMARRIRTSLGRSLGIADGDVYLVRRRSIRRTTSGKYQRIKMRDLVQRGQLGAELLDVFAGG